MMFHPAYCDGIHVINLLFPLISCRNVLSIRVLYPGLGYVAGANCI